MKTPWLLGAAIVCGLSSAGSAPGDRHGSGAADLVSALDYSGVDNTGATDSTVGMAQAVADAASRGKKLMLPCGTYLTDNLPIVSGSQLVAAQRSCVTLKRKSGASGHYVMSATGVHGFVLGGLALDANGAGNAGNPGSGLHISGSYQFAIRHISTTNANSIDAGNFGVGLQIDGCLDGAQGTRSEVLDSTFAGVSNASLSGLLVQKCQNLTVDGNTAHGNLYAGIALLDQTLPVPTTPPNTNVRITHNRTYANGIGIDISGFTAGPGIGGAPIASKSNFVSSSLVVSDNESYGNTRYGCLIQAADVVVANNHVTGNGTGKVYGGCAVSSTRFSVTGNVVTGNSYYGLDVGGSSYGVVSGNTVRQNGTAIGQAIGLNLGATVGVTVGINDVGDNGGALGGWEVLGSALDGSGPGNFFPWVGSGLKLDGLKISPTHAAMGGLHLANGWSRVDVSNVTVDNAVGSAHPFDVYTNGPTLHMSGNKVIDNTGSWTPSIASASTIVIPDWADTALVTGTATINTILGSAQNDLNGGLREFVPSNKGSGYTSGTTAVCTATGGTPATVTPAVSANGSIYGLYVNTPGGGASAMTCTVSDQTCTAAPGAVALSGGAVTSVGTGSGGSGCASPPAVVLSGLTCAAQPAIHASVAGGAVTGYVVDYGGSGCTGTGSAAILNGSGFAGTAHLGAGQPDKTIELRFSGRAILKSGTGNISAKDGKPGAASAIRLRSANGNWYGTSATDTVPPVSR